MFYKWFNLKCMVKHECIPFGHIGVFLHYKIQMHSKESYTIVLYTVIGFRGIKILLCYELQLHSKESKYYCIAKWVQIKKLLLQYELNTS